MIMNNKQKQLLASEEAAFNSIVANMVVPGTVFFIFLLVWVIYKILNHITS